MLNVNCLHCFTKATLSAQPHPISYLKLKVYCLPQQTEEMFLSITTKTD